MKNCLMLLFLALSSHCMGQPNEPGYPLGLLYTLPTEDLPEITLPYYDNEELQNMENCENCGFLFGRDIRQPYDFMQLASTMVIEENGYALEVKRLLINSPSAFALQVYFSHFELDTGVKFYIYSTEHPERVIGAFTQNNNRSDFSFITNDTWGKTMILELDRRIIGSVNNTASILHISGFVHIFWNRFDFNDAIAFDPCVDNVLCQPLNNTWCNQLRSVVKLRNRINDTLWSSCSGSIINTTDDNWSPLLLTAEHCVDFEDIQLSQAYFNFHSPFCVPTTMGNDMMMLQGMSVVVTDEGSELPSCPDVGLLRLNDSIPLQYNVFFAGWNREGWNDLPDDHEGTVIHHLQGDVKKFSVGDIRNSSADLNGCLRVDWTDGLVFFGSSGAPLFVSSGHIIGTVSHGPTNTTCANPSSGDHSWLNKSWNVLQPHLAPGNTEVQVHDGRDPVSACISHLHLSRIFYPGNDWQRRNQITIQAANTIILAESGVETAVSNSPAYMTVSHNADYIVRAGNHITIHPGFHINTPFRPPGSGVYTTDFRWGSGK
ncbi:MAG: S1 family peptidase [Bacteroidota bacterium]|nr:S1 family peptidase [Bacteroidota bacterium]